MTPPYNSGKEQGGGWMEKFQNNFTYTLFGLVPTEKVVNDYSFLTN